MHTKGLTVWCVLCIFPVVASAVPLTCPETASHAVEEYKVPDLPAGDWNPGSNREYCWRRPNDVHYVLLSGCGGGAGGDWADHGGSGGGGAPITTLLVGPLDGDVYTITLGTGGRAGGYAPSKPGSPPGPNFQAAARGQPTVFEGKVPAIKTMLPGGKVREGGQGQDAGPDGVQGTGGAGGSGGGGGGSIGPGGRAQATSPSSGSSNGARGGFCAGGGGAGFTRAVGGAGGPGYLRLVPIVDVESVLLETQKLLAQMRQTLQARGASEGTPSQAPTGPTPSQPK
jgi:hypothetical protein